MYRIIVIGVLFIITLSCHDNKTPHDELEIISSIYNSIPRYLLSPPPPINPNELDSATIKKIGFSQRDTLKFKHAIYHKFFNDSIIKIVDQQTIKEIDFNSITEFEELNKELISPKVLNNTLLENVILIDKKMISAQDKKKYGITNVLSFSKIYFNKSKTQAIVGVQNFSEGLDSSYTIYYLMKSKNKWGIVEKDVISFS